MDEYISRHEAIRAVQLSYGNYEATRKAILNYPPPTSRLYGMKSGCIPTMKTALSSLKL